MHRIAGANAEGLAHAWGRIQLKHAKHANPLPGLCSLCQGLFFKLNDKFEHIPFLAHPLNAH